MVHVFFVIFHMSYFHKMLLEKLAYYILIKMGLFASFRCEFAHHFDPELCNVGLNKDNASLTCFN